MITFFFSLSVLADGPFNEYGGYGSPEYYTRGENAETSFWANNVTRLNDYMKNNYRSITINGSIQYTAPVASVNYYVGSASESTQEGFSTAKSILEYQYKPGDVIYLFDLYDINTDGNPTTVKYDSNGNIRHGFIITNNNISLFYPNNNGYDLNHANTAILNNFTSEPNRPNFSYNSYNINTNTVTEKIYKATPNGPELVRTRDLRSYDKIPRIVKTNPNFAPMSPFDIAGKIMDNGSPELSLYDGYKIIRDRLDYTAKDDVREGNNGRGDREKEILDRVIPRIRERLPDDLKPYTESILAMYIEECDENPDIHPGLLMSEFLNMQKVDDIALPANIPFVDGKNYVFDSNGNPKEAGANGNLIQIEVNGVKKLPSQLNVNDLSQLKALSKVAVCLAKMNGAPVGSWFNTGVQNKTSSEVPAFTQGENPFMTILNHKGGKFSESLDNVYSFMNIIQHELGHQYNFKHGIPSNVLTHVDVYIDAMETIQFKKSPASFKLSIVKSLANYIWNIDKKAGYTLTQTINKINTFNGRSISNGGYKLIAPKDPDNLAHILFKRGELGINTTNAFKVYNPETNTEEIVKFELNNEK